MIAVLFVVIWNTKFAQLAWKVLAVWWKSLFASLEGIALLVTAFMRWWLMEEVPRFKGSLTPAKSLWNMGKVLQELEAKSPWKMGSKVLQELEAKVPGKWAKSFSWRQKVPGKWAAKSFKNWRQKSLENGQKTHL